MDIKKILDFFNIDKDLELDSLTDREYFFLHVLIKNIIYNNRENHNINNSQPMVFNIGNMNIATLIEINEINEMRIHNLFNKETELEIQLTDSEKNINVKGSIFVILKAEKISSIDNINYEILENAFVNKKVYHPAN